MWKDIPRSSTVKTSRAKTINILFFCDERDLKNHQNPRTSRNILGPVFHISPTKHFQRICLSASLEGTVKNESLDFFHRGRNRIISTHFFFTHLYHVANSMIKHPQFVEEIISSNIHPQNSLGLFLGRPPYIISAPPSCNPPALAEVSGCASPHNSPHECIFFFPRLRQVIGRGQKVKYIQWSQNFICWLLSSHQNWAL